MLVEQFEVGVGARFGADLGTRIGLGDEADIRAQFTRRNSGAGRATVTLSFGQAVRVSDRMAAIGSIRDWHHELVVRVDGADAFAGPVVDSVVADDVVQVTAEDYSACWRRAFLPGPIEIEQADALRVLDAAFRQERSDTAAIDPSGGRPWRPDFSGRSLGRYMDLSVDAGDDVSLDQIVSDATDVGWTWTWLGSTLLTGRDGLIYHGDDPLTVRLTDEDWAVPPKLRRDGAERATRVIVHGEAGIRAVATAEQEWIDYYGLVTKTVERPDVRSYAAAAVVAELTLAESVEPVRPETAVLARTATVSVAELIPGARAYVSSAAWEGDSPTLACRIGQVSVSASGKVVVGFDPIPTTEAVAGVEIG